MSKQKTKYHLRKRMFLNRFTDMPAFVIGIVEDARDSRRKRERLEMGRNGIDSGGLPASNHFQF